MKRVWSNVPIAMSRARLQLHQMQDIVDCPLRQKQVKALTATSEALQFWDTPTEATRIMQQLSTLQAFSTQWTECSQQVQECQELYELAKEEGDEEVLQECHEVIEGVLTVIARLRLERWFNGEWDTSSCLVEIQAGAGGTESCDWVAMLLRMYLKWGKQQQFKTHIMSVSEGEETGYRSVVLKVDGPFAYGWHRSEAGTHRLVRISPFNTAGRRHTSFAQVRLYPISSATEESSLPSHELRIDTYRSSGPGGQHANTTDSAVRITHLPTGLVAQSQSDRSQHRNKADALQVLTAKVVQQRREAARKEHEQFTHGLGSNEFGNQIRSYVLHPYQMVKDHRTNVTLNDAKSVLDGDLAELIESVLSQTSSSATVEKRDTA